MWPGCDVRTRDYDKDLEVRREAERRVVAVRGSYGAPGFEACVEVELADLRRHRANAMRAERRREQKRIGKTKRIIVK